MLLTGEELLVDYYIFCHGYVKRRVYIYLIKMADVLMCIKILTQLFEQGVKIMIVIWSMQNII